MNLQDIENDAANKWFELLKGLGPIRHFVRVSPNGKKTYWKQKTKLSPIVTADGNGTFSVLDDFEQMSGSDAMLRGNVGIFGSTGA